ncbi:shootin-1-like [Melopsittacus undulatus]|uniref:shootin-1-like n=1 Tax=Melopsittacus undulatus TaxID=13146 RepID=UPI00146ED987|nr:shootin-1-like [Melopsittacus undulatus]
MAMDADGTGQLAAILEWGSSEEEEEEEDEEAAVVQVCASPCSPPPHGQEPGEAEQRLAELEQASQALLMELSALETECEIERMCREQAEAYAAQVKQENKQLKRLSLNPAAPEALLEEVPPEEDPDPAQCHGQQLEALHKKISWLLEQRKDLSIRVQELQEQLEQGQQEQQRLRAALGTSQRALRSFKRVSHIITQDYCEAVQQLELEQDLRLHAEAFAHEMLVQTEEAKRQSSILLQGRGHSTQLLMAMQDVADLTRALEEARLEQRQREQELGKRPAPQELDEARAALAAAEEEKLQLRMRLQEAEQRLQELQEEVRLLQKKLAQDPLVQSQAPMVPAPPPPPPPLPPPAPTVPVDPLLAIRQRKGLVNLQRSKPEAEDAKARAVQEMMERIKNGVVLRPAKDRDPLAQGSKRRSTALELQSILGAMRRASRRAGARQSSLKGKDQQLEAILQRRRRAMDADPEGHRDAEDAQCLDPGDEDLGAAPSGCSHPGHRDRVPFRPRVSSGLPRTRPGAVGNQGRGGGITFPGAMAGGGDG